MAAIIVAYRNITHYQTMLFTLSILIHRVCYPCFILGTSYYYPPLTLDFTFVFVLILCLYLNLLKVFLFISKLPVY